MEWRENFADDALEVKVAELLVATADESDHLIDRSVPEVLKLLRERMKMDVVFVAEFAGGNRLVRFVEQPPGMQVVAAGQVDPPEDTWCQRVVDGRLPELIPEAAAVVASGAAPDMGGFAGTYISTPVVLGSGEVYGTLCCLSFAVNTGTTEKDVQKLRYTAQLTAAKIDRSRQRASNLALEPMANPVQRRL